MKDREAWQAAGLGVAMSQTFASWQESYEKLRVLKSRDLTLPTNVCIVKTMVFPVVMYVCENWTVKKVQC